MPKHLKDSKSARHWDACISMLITPLFTISKKWNQSRCASPDEQTKKNVAQMHNVILFGYKKINILEGQ